jgi:hypothetical protein
MYTGNGYPIGVTHLLKEPPEEIIKYGNQVLRGLLTQQRGCVNFYKGSRIQYIVQFSIAKTLARKFDISIKKVFARYGRVLMVNYKNAKGKTCSVSLALYKSFARQKDFFAKIKLAVKSFFFLPMYSLRDPLARVCYICGNPHSNVSMYHGTPKRSSTSLFTNVLVTRTSTGVSYPFAQHCFANVEADSFSLIR